METKPDRGTHAYWLTATKLQPPHQRQDLVPRPQLLAELNDAVNAHPLTLVSAPAGYGKTTLLAAFVDTSPTRATTWLSLDQEDNDPARFLSAVVAAIKRAVPGYGARVQSVLASLPNLGTEVRRVVGVLVNEVIETVPGSIILVLEDLHMITESTIYVALDYLLERQPSQMRLVVSSRHDPPLPLARLRARGQMAEIRLSSLRFTMDEATAFLNKQLGSDLTGEELASLYVRTEGWPAGLRLVASSLGQIPESADRTALITRLTETNAYIFDFLADEVLSRQSEEVRTFLLETSILQELVPKLCQAITGQRDALVILEDMYRRNLFITAVDEVGAVYRYHHLFAEFLRQRLAREKPGSIPELHRKAAEAEDVPAHAISHYLAAQLWEPAVKMMERAGEELLRDGLRRMLVQWIESLPSSVREAHPRLIYFLGVSALQSGDLEQASVMLERARHGFEISGDVAGQGEALQELVGVTSQQHDYTRQAILIDQALAYPISVHGRVQLLMARAWQSVYEADQRKADADLDEVITLTIESGEPRAFAVVAPILRAHLALLPGGTARLEHYCRQVLARFGNGIGVVQAGAHCMLGYIYSLRGQINESVLEAKMAGEISQSLGGFHFLDWEVDMVLTSASMARGDYAASERRWVERLSVYEATPAISPWTVTFLYCIGRAQWLQGHMEKARNTLARMSSLAHEQTLPELTISLALMRALVEIGDRQYSEAERILRPAVTTAEQSPYCMVFCNARLLIAYLYLCWDRPENAASELTPLLESCERNGTPGLILREGAALAVPLLRLAVVHEVHTSFATRLLDILDAGKESFRFRVPDTGQTLTVREVEVLRLIAEGASNRAIAERLVITERTVKSHVTSLLNKLNIQSRTQAAARARGLRIV